MELAKFIFISVVSQTLTKPINILQHEKRKNPIKFTIQSRLTLTINNIRTKKKFQKNIKIRNKQNPKKARLADLRDLPTQFHVLKNQKTDRQTSKKPTRIKKKL